MRKNQDKDAKKEALERTVKTDSEKKESAKKKKAPEKGPELNDPMYDVTVDTKGNADIVSEKAIEEVDYPPELAEFLGEVLQGVRENLGIPKDEEIPIDELQSFFGRLFEKVDLEKMIHELRAEKVFGISEDDSVPKVVFQDEEDVSPDSLLDEDLLNMDLSKLEVDKNGNRILGEFTLDCPVEPKGIVSQQFPVQIDEEFIKNRVYIQVRIPFIMMIPLAEITPESEYYEMSGTFLMNETHAFQVHPDTYDELQELLDKCGVIQGQKEIKEGENVAEKVAEYFASGDVINGDFSAREDGYYEDLREYWYDGQIYHEGDVIWFEIPCSVSLTGAIKGFVANIDSFMDLYTPCDVTAARKIKVEGNRRILSNQEKFNIMYYNLNEDFFTQLLPYENVWQKAKEFARTKDTPGYCAVCLDGRFNVPVESFFNPITFECESLIVAFNVIPCIPVHHHCAGVLVADVGNMQIHTAVRYAKGRIFNWQKRVDQELEVYRLKNPDFDPYDDPYDNPHNTSFDDEDND